MGLLNSSLSFTEMLIFLLIYAVAVLIALTFHEYAHGQVAAWLGDQTAREQGRLTLNPIAHLDPVGAILLLIIGFGWAKPVPVNPFHLRGNRRRGMLLVAAAGPLMNMLLALIVMVAFHIIGYSQGLVYSFIGALVTININLAAFNLIPIPPLDGSKILAGFLPRQKAFYLESFLDSYGMVILMVLVFTGLYSWIMRPILYVVELIVNTLARLITGGFMPF